MSPTYRRPSLLDLPDEILLQILAYLRIIRSYKTQSQAFRLKQEEITRQSKNRQREAAFYSLCLTSKRLHRVATPVLYEAFVNTTTWQGFKPLCLFLRTISQCSSLAYHVQYIENRLWDYLGNGLYDDLEFYGATEMVREYYETLATVIRLCRNISHLTVVSLETAEVSLWRGLIQLKSSPTQMASHGFLKLHTLCLQIHTEDYGLGEESSWFRRIANALLTVPTLKTLRASGVTSGDSAFVTGEYQSLETIDISECILDFDEVVQIASASPKLKHFGCSWAYLNSQGFHLPDLYASLNTQKKSLEYLCLDTREVRFCAEDFPFQPFGSIRDFEALKTIEMCEMSLLANTMSLLDFPDQRLPIRISELLPPCLESLSIMVKSEYGYNDDCRVDEVFALWDLADDCSKMLPYLRKVQIKSVYELSALLLTSRYREVGVTLSLVKEQINHYD
ncbi:hypothetical protein B0J11DRAFT_442813 [Dendryphion nanum]|uniref:F-box domain-containing protein n=1 Tax=Dendryphion nanum TaxID=256645 RepID=A0A9P9IEQ1_9PLEO|nr:hypothetical protein B0J11DRAFT_442813 [Dendryphion nanum]